MVSLLSPADNIGVFAALAAKRSKHIGRIVAGIFPAMGASYDAS